MDLDIRDVRVFVAVASTLSFTKACDIVQVNQPQISLRIKSLEDRIGYRLFYRTSRDVRLTLQGERLVPHAKQLLEAHSRTLDAIADIGLEISSTLRVGSLDYFQPLRRRFLAAYMKLHPADVVEVQSTSTRDALTLMQTGQLDLTFMSLPDSEKLPADIDTMLLASAPIGLLLPDKSTLAAGAVLEPPDLRGLNIAIFRRELAPSLYDAILSLISGLEVRVTRLPEPSEAGLADYVRSTGTPAICAQWWLQDEDRPAGLVHRPIAGAKIHFHSLLTRPRSHASPPCNRLWRMVQRALPQPTI